MTQYHTFIGIDIGKFTFVVFNHSTNKTVEYENNSSGISNFIKDHKDWLSESLCVLETTGGYELELTYTLCTQNYSVHRADARKVKNFNRSFGQTAKTDSLDARTLARYGVERHAELELFQALSKHDLELFQLIQRRTDLKKTLVAEKNRVQSPSYSFVKESCLILIQTLEIESKKITNLIKEKIQGNKGLKQKYKTLKSIPGIGDIVAFELLVLLPELGKLNRRKIACLAGLAPMANESGTFKGYRKTYYGRRGVKPILFIAAMAARNSKSELKEFYEKLVQKGKKKMVALTALMRKILIIANAKIKDIN